jgi:hypothetical protein
MHVLLLLQLLLEKVQQQLLLQQPYGQELFPLNLCAQLRHAAGVEHNHLQQLQSTKGIMSSNPPVFLPNSKQ